MAMDGTTTERVGRAVALLYAGGSWPTRRLAERLGISTAGAWAMLARLARVLPITLDADGWRLLEDD